MAMANLTLIWSPLGRASLEASQLLLSSSRHYWLARRGMSAGVLEPPIHVLICGYACLRLLEAAATA